MQDSSKVVADGAAISQTGFKPGGWYRATVPGTILTTLVDNKVYPEPLYGENMRTIPESLNKTSYWYRANFAVPAADKGRHTWLHLGGINYSAEVWVNGHRAGTMLGALVRGDFDVTQWVKPGKTAGLAVLVHPQPHHGISKSRVLPVFYSDNYFSLIPDEVKTVSIEVATKDLAGEPPLLEVDGLNLDLLPSTSEVSVIPNENADPMLHPASQLVPAVFK